MATIRAWDTLARQFLTTVPSGVHDKAILGMTIAMAEFKFVAGYPDAAVEDLTDPDRGARMVADNLRLTEVVHEIERIVTMMYQTDEQ